MELQHHGVKGMRWGVRRFQKKDGTLTPSGKKRYGQDSSVVKKDTDRGPDTQIMDEKMKAMDGKSLADYVSKNVSEEDYTSMNNAIGTYMDTEWELDDALHGYGDVKAATGKRNDAEKILRSEISKQSKKYMDIDFDPNGKFNNARDRDAIERYVVNMEGSYDELKRMSHSDMLMHHGIKGQKWGVRRFRNEDGTLTAAGRKRVSKEYRKAIAGVNKEFSKQQSKMYVNAHNKAADKYNTEFTKKYNEDWERKHGKDSFGSDEYTKTYMDGFNKEIVKNYNQSLAQFYKSSPSYNKAKSLVDSYGMKDWDSFAKQNEDAVDEIRRTVERYSR